MRLSLPPQRTVLDKRLSFAQAVAARYNRYVETSGGHGDATGDIRVSGSKDDAWPWGVPHGHSNGLKPQLAHTVLQSRSVGSVLQWGGMGTVPLNTPLLEISPLERDLSVSWDVTERSQSSVARLSNTTLHYRNDVYQVGI